MRESSSTALSRRGFIGAAAAAGTTMLLPSGAALAQPKAKYRRLNLSAPVFPSRMLDSYKRAIRASLALPPTDPRNWYRQALVHTLDCPHGNWWFLVWHRAYIGWFEQVCRDLSGDPEFAFPYWDWTKQPAVPPEMLDDVLTPTHPAFIPALTDFKAKFQDVIADNWKSLSDDQTDQLLVRNLRFPDDLWFDIGYPKSPFFFDLAHARGGAQLDGKTKVAVSSPTLIDALSPRDYISFASPKTLAHSGLTGFGVLEGQPHNRVHNCVGGIFTDSSGHTTNVGGFMQGNLSPVDPLFYLHHANIDRIWDVWTRKQAARGYPILPQGYPAQAGATVPPGSDFALWSQEPFLFFTDGQGKPVARNTAGAYATIGDFDYDYQSGSGEEVVPVSAAVTAARPAPALQRFNTQVRSAAGTAGSAVFEASATLNPALLAANEGSDAPKLFALVTVALPPLSHTGDFNVTLNAPAGTAATDASSPHFVASLTMFGHHIVQGPVTFMVPLSRSLTALRSSKLLDTSAPINLQVAPAAAVPGHGMTMAQTPASAQVLSVVVEAH